MSTPAKVTKTPYIVAVILLIVGIVIGYGIGSVTAPKPAEVTAPGGLTGEVRIGALLPLSGVLSTFGAQYKEVLALAEREINDYLAAAGKNWRIKFVIEDTATDPRTHYNKLVALHGTGVKIFIGGASSAELSESLTYCNQNDLLIFSPSSTSPALAIKDNGFRYTPNDIVQGKAIARIMWLRGIRWVIPVWRGDTWGDGLKRYTVERFNEICKASGESCGVLEDYGIRYDPAAKEFSAEAAALASRVSDAVSKYGKDKVGVLLISFEEAAAWFAAIKAYPVLLEVQWEGSDGTAAIAPLVQDPSVADVAIAVKFYNTMASPGVSPHGEKIRKLVREKLGLDPMGYTYFAYDIAWTIALAIDAAGAYDTAKVKQVLPYVLERYMGASGYIKLDENGDRAIADYDLWAVVKVDGKPQWKVIGLYHGLTDSVEWYTS